VFQGRFLTLRPDEVVETRAVGDERRVFRRGEVPSPLLTRVQETVLLEVMRQGEPNVTRVVQAIRKDQSNVSSVVIGLEQLRLLESQQRNRRSGQGKQLSLTQEGWATARRIERKHTFLAAAVLPARRLTPEELEVLQLVERIKRREGKVRKIARQVGVVDRSIVWAHLRSLFG
jgi:hypothetical protein